MALIIMSLRAVVRPPSMTRRVDVRLPPVLLAIHAVLLTEPEQRTEFTSRTFSSEHVIRFVRLGRLALIPLCLLGGWICCCWTATSRQRIRDRVD